MWCSHVIRAAVTLHRLLAASGTTAALSSSAGASGKMPPGGPHADASSTRASVVARVTQASYHGAGNSETLEAHGVATLARLAFAARAGAGTASRGARNRDRRPARPLSDRSRGARRERAADPV